MNKRIKNKAEKAKRKEIHALLDTVLDINGLYPRKRAETGSLPTSFIEFSGHTGTLYLSVHGNGWYPDESADFNGEARAFDSSGVMELSKKLKARYL